MLAALEGFITIGVVVAVGWLLARRRVVGRSAQRALGDVAFFVGQPTLVLTAVARADVHQLFGLHVLAFGLACVSCGLGYATLMRRRWHATRGEAVVGYLATSYVNGGNLGIPLAVFILGDAAWAAPAMMLQVLIIQPSAVAMLESSGLGAGRSVLRTFATHPLVLGGIVGLAINLTGVELPEVVWAPIDLLADLAVPAMLLAFGMSLHSNPLPALRSMSAQYLTGIAAKSFVVPAVALLIALALGLGGDQLKAAVLLAALPTAQVVFVHALRYRTGLGLVQAVTLWSTVFSVPVVVAASAFVA